MKKQNPKNDLKQILGALDVLALRLHALDSRLESVEGRDLLSEIKPLLTKLAASDPPSGKIFVLTAEARAVRETLRAGPLTAVEIAEQLGHPVYRVHRLLKTMGRHDYVRFHYEDREKPRWEITEPDAVPFEDILIRVETLIRQNPLTQGELEILVGARRSRVNDALERLKESGAIQDKQYRAAWFIPASAEQAKTELAYNAKAWPRSNAAARKSGRDDKDQSRSRRWRRDPTSSKRSKL